MAVIGAIVGHQVISGLVHNPFPGAEYGGQQRGPRQGADLVVGERQEPPEVHRHLSWRMTKKIQGTRCEHPFYEDKQLTHNNNNKDGNKLNTPPAHAPIESIIAA